MAAASPLNTPVTLPCGVTVKNRFYKGAMNEGFANPRLLAPTANHVRLYQHWANGGAGVLVSGNVMVDRSHNGEPGNLVLEDDRHLNRFKAVAKAGTANGAHLWMQINHPGKQSPRSLNPEPVAPSAIPLHGGLGRFFAPPRALTLEEIHEVIQRFITTATLAKAAGYTGIEIHAAHGYLLSQFLSGTHNQRTDAYGGSLESRMRILIEIYQGIREALGPAFPIAVKMNSSDGNPGGLTEDESLIVAQTLADLGVDVLVISGGTYEQPVHHGSEPAQTGTRRGVYYADYAKRLAERVTTPIALTGGFRSIDDMESAITKGATTFIGIARPLVMRPNLPIEFITGTNPSPAVLHRVSTPIKPIDRALGQMLGLIYYEWQMANIAKHGQPKLTTNALWAVLAAVKQHGLGFLGPRRA